MLFVCVKPSCYTCRVQDYGAKKILPASCMEPRYFSCCVYHPCKVMIRTASCCAPPCLRSAHYPCCKIMVQETKCRMVASNLPAQQCSLRCVVMVRAAPYSVVSPIFPASICSVRCGGPLASRSWWHQTSPAPPWCSSHVQDNESNLILLVVASHLSSVDDRSGHSRCRDLVRVTQEWLWEGMCS